MTDLPKPEWIDKQQALQQWMQRLAQAPAIGIDTEADSFFAYREKVCLIQISLQDQDFIIDPLAGLDLSALGAVLASSSITKVFHDGEYDVGMLKKDFGFSFAGIFDTRVAVAALGSKKPGLASVIQERFGVVLDKKFQRSNWAERPLSQEQIEYARMDTRFLIPLHEQLKQELQSADRLHVAESEFRRIERLGPKEQVFNPDEFIRLKGARLLHPVSLQILKAIFVKREQFAERFGVPPFKVIPNETLIELARIQPEDLKGMTRAKGFTWKSVKRFGEELLESIRLAKESGPLQRWPSIPKKDGTGVFSREETLIYEKLRQWRKEKAEKEGFDSSQALRRETLIELVKRRPKCFKDLERVSGIEPWQIESYGHELLEFFRRFQD